MYVVVFLCMSGIYLEIKKCTLSVAFLHGLKKLNCMKRCTWKVSTVSLWGLHPEQWPSWPNDSIALGASVQITPQSWQALLGRPWQGAREQRRERNSAIRRIWLQLLQPFSNSSSSLGSGWQAATQACFTFLTTRCPSLDKSISHSMYNTFRCCVVVAQEGKKQVS